MGKFSDQVSAWAKKSPERLVATYRRSIELLAEEMVRTKGQGGRVPFQTGNLSRSLLASTQGMPKISNSPGAGGNVGIVTATLKLNQTIWLGYQAAYAARRNFGFVGTDSLGRKYNEGGDHFLEGAIAQWPQFVEQAARELQQGVESRS